MKVYVFPADNYGCGWYRLMFAAYHLRSQGHDVEVIPPGHPRTAMMKGTIRGGKTLAVSYPRDADVLVFQRITHQHLAEAIPLYRERGIAVVIDMDDDLLSIHPKNPAWVGMHPNSNTKHSWQYAMDACKDATLVTVSTPPLLKRYANNAKHGVIIDNYIPAKYLDIEHQDSDVIGWGGAVSSHPDDLQVTGTAISTMVSNGSSFAVVGSGKDVQQVLRLPSDWHNATGIVDIHAWGNALSSTIGIGIAPLADSKFNHSKSRLKCIEMSALGIPWVASPRAEYKKFHALGVGLLADRPKHWLRHLQELTRDPELRQEMSAKGREVASELTVEKNSWRWMEAWEKAYELQKSS